MLRPLALVRLAAAAFALLSLAATARPLAAAEDVVGETAYYPLQVDTEWEYSAGASTVVAKVVRHEMKGAYMTARVEAVVDGRVVMTENLTVTKDAILRVAAGDVVASKPTIVLKLPPKAGDKWRIDAEVGREKLEGDFTSEAVAEKIKVPAGEFTAVKVAGTYAATAESGEKQEISIQSWYAEGTGPVKAVLKARGTETALELKKYAPAK